MKPESLHDLYVMELKDLYNAEQQIIKALPDMIEAADAPQLRNAFEEHLEQTRGQVSRLERIFEMLDEPPKGQKCKGMEGVIDEGKDLMDDTEDSPPAVCDAALISAAQRVEHYEIAGYGSCRTYARRLGLDEQARLLQETLNEEEETDRRLTEIAESYINEEARSAK